MIGYIKGKVLSHSDNVVLIENNGIGYEVACSSSVYNKLISQGQGEVYTYLAVREDGVYLYGFISLEEKEMFMRLISVSGVGPKMGITILSNMEIGDLAIKIATSDVKGLSKIKGLGKKTAERIILELRENISSLDLPEGGKKSSNKKPDAPAINDDAVIALMSLGFNRAESETAVASAMERGADTIETIITIALQTIK